MTEALDRRVTALIAAQARRPETELAPEVTLAALGIDSLNMVELVFAIEEAFDIRVPFRSVAGAEAEAEDMATVGSVIAAVRGLVAARGP